MSDPSDRPGQSIDMRLVAAAIGPHERLQELRRRIAEPGLDCDSRDGLMREAIATASGLYRRLGLAPIADELDGIAVLWGKYRP